MDWLTTGSAPPPHRTPGLDAARPNPARIYDYLLGGKDNFAVDRDAGDALIARLPTLPAMTRAVRDFLHRAVRHLVRVRGVRQFLDIGSGLPTACNVHEVALEADPGARVVYVDADPVVAAHSRALLADHPGGSTAFVEADATDPASVLAAPALGATLDLSEPVGLLVVDTLTYFPDPVARDVVATLLAALAPGSYLTISHPTPDFAPEATRRTVAAVERSGLSCTTRTQDEVRALFAGTELVEPGLVPLLSWHPDARDAVVPDPCGVYAWAGVARRR
ncbi:SAM-dependent methyltransferase [Pseudonocardia lacus]|uniref:SAM-dependent methyltransferase n=1 Tax=Pseudonocardia lacus TaxID=2835865 RepID=UPI0027E258C3|nr:SAM-dependent methyltransferase [Pseudonocardia lacus]